MTDHNSIKADEYAQRQGEMDEFDDAVYELAQQLFDSLPDWVNCVHSASVQNFVMASKEAKRRVMQAIKERNEP